MSLATIEKPEVKVARQRPQRKFFWLCAQFFVFLLVGLLLLEPILTLAGVADEEVLDIDEKLGWIPMPNRSSTYRTEGFSRSKINSLGMRDIERTVAKPANTYRIAVLGCSQTEGRQVPIEKTYCQLLEKQLNNESKTIRYEVLNFAVSAYSLGQEYLCLRHKVLQFQPDLVIFTARPNSILYMGPTLKKGFINSPPLFGVLPDGSLVEDHNKQNMWLNSADGKRFKIVRWLRYHSRLWGVLGKCSLALSQFRMTSETYFKNFMRGEFALPSVAGETKSQEPVKADPSLKPAMDYLGKVAAAIVKSAEADCRKAGCRFVLLYLPASERYRDEREKQIFYDIARQQKLNFIDLNPEFDRLEKNPKNLFYVLVHLSAAGNEAIAKSLYKHLSGSSVLK